MIIMIIIKIIIIVIIIIKNTYTKKHKEKSKGNIIEDRQRMKVEGRQEGKWKTKKEIEAENRLNLDKAVFKLMQNLMPKLHFNGFLFSGRVFSNCSC